MDVEMNEEEVEAEFKAADKMSEIPGTRINFLELMNILYTKKHVLVGTGYTYKDGDDVQGYGVFEDDGKQYRVLVTDNKSATHLLTLKVVTSPLKGQTFAKPIDNNKHFKDQHELIWDLDKKVIAARQRLVKGEQTINFPWADLLHDGFEDKVTPFGAKYLPLKENFHALMAHAELMGAKCVIRAEKMQASPLHKESADLVKDTLGFVQPKHEFAHQILDLPGGAPRFEHHVSNQVHIFHTVLKDLSRIPGPDAKTTCFVLMAVYAATLEMLRLPLLVLAKSAEKNAKSPEGHTEGEFTPLLEFLTSHPAVGTRYARFIDAELRHHFAHSAYRIEGKEVILLQRDLKTEKRRIHLDKLTELVTDLLVRFTPAALNGAVMSYYLDVRLMMQTLPYVQWMVAIGNTKG